MGFASKNEASLLLRRAQEPKGNVTYGEYLLNIARSGINDEEILRILEGDIYPMGSQAFRGYGTLNAIINSKILELYM